ncbi:hypothetical protein SBF1_1370009 [Candidatus Desulfosporosinus infrequens]|uniref:Uncharacterized protein n=1 Tax=Candidatus Desulfosporosinus infrequens TaxID=2043169 RepID=A0A2U3K4P2_9FIRM|nr:hypothetical protein SBF1_1370009 [Candidatus Desulfosporosinus infrequens]
MNALLDVLSQLINHRLHRLTQNKYILALNYKSLVTQLMIAKVD